MGVIDKCLEIREGVRRFVLAWVHPQELGSEKRRAELNVVLKEHWKPDSIDVYELILEIWEPDKVEKSPTEIAPKDDRFIVFIDPDFDVDWITKSNQKDAEGDKAISFAESIGARRCKHLPDEQVLELKRIVGQAIVNGIQGEWEQSYKLAEQAAQFLKDRTVERSRSWTLTSAHFFLFLFSAVLALFHDCPRISSLWERPDLFLLWSAIQGGVIGAYLSVVRRAGRGEWDAAAGLALHRVEVFTKLFAGGILGGIAFALSRSMHAPAYLKDITPDGYSALVFGVAAGLFEGLIPKMISNYSKSEKQHHIRKQ
jgi:hypothetical protein